MKKLLAVFISLVMVVTMAASVFAEPAEVTWEDYQQYLIDTAGANAPDIDEFTAQVEAIGSWEDIDQTVSPWDMFFTTLGLSTWDEFQQGIVKEIEATGPMGGGESPEGESPAEAAPAPEGESPADAAPEGEAPAAPPADSPEGESPEGESPEGESAGGPGLQEEEFEITVGDVTGIAHYQDLESDSEKRAFVITFDGKEYSGKIDKGVWTADDPEGADVIAAFQAAHEADPSFMGPPPAGN